MKDVTHEIQQVRAFYPRVSEIIGKQNEMEMRAIPIETLVNAQIRGTAVHNYCTAYLEGLFMPEIEAEYQPYVDAFIAWAEERVERVILTKTRLYDDVKQFTGEFDAIVILKDCPDPVLIDIKATATKSKSWPLQLAAYRHLCGINILFAEEAMNVHLKVKTPAQYEQIDGQKILISPAVITAKEVPYVDLMGAWDIFSSALKCYNYFDRKEPKEEKEAK